MSVRKILLARPRGFCAGVEMSVKALIWLTRSLKNKKIYCYHEIVHNELVVTWFEQRGVTFVKSLAEIPHDHDEDIALMLSAHGTDPKIVSDAEARFSIVVNSACPLVTKVHNEVIHAQERGAEVVYLGDPHHDEGAGTLGVAERRVHIVRPRHWAADVATLPDLNGRPVTFLTQTTLSQSLYQEVHTALKSRFGRISTPAKSDLCFATTNRQDVATAMARQCDHVIVVGSVQSANTKSLFDMVAPNCASVFLVNDPMDLRHDELGGVVGVTAGASAPEMLVQQICDAINPAEGIEPFEFEPEPQYFNPPPALRRLAADPKIEPYYELDKDDVISVLELMRDL